MDQDRQQTALGRCERSWMEAQSSLLFEWGSYTDKERARLTRRNRELASRLDQLSEEWEDYRDAVVQESKHRIEEADRRSRAFDENVAIVQVFQDDGTYAWVAFPEANRHLIAEGYMTLYHDDGDGTLALIRSIPLLWAGEIRNVPRGHELLADAEVYRMQEELPEPQPIDVGAGGDWAGVPTPSADE